MPFRAALGHATWQPERDEDTYGLENAQYIAGHASASTTKLYDRRGDKIALGARSSGSCREKASGADALLHRAISP
jgi:hypothetical protein